MFIGMLFGVFVAVAGLTLSSAAAPEPTFPASPPVRRAAQRRLATEHARRRPAERALVVPVDDLRPVSSEIYSLRARRRFAAFLRFRLLEMRKAGLERAAAVIEHRLPVDTLVGR